MENRDFEENLEALEKIVGDLESGDLKLSDALNKFETGIQHYSTCLEILNNAEAKISVLKANIDTGELEKEPFEGENRI